TSRWRCDRSSGSQTRFATGGPGRGWGCPPAVGGWRCAQAAARGGPPPPRRGAPPPPCRYAIERGKQIAPIWKREFFDGGDIWIEGATADPEDSRARAEAERIGCGEGSGWFARLA